MRRLTGVRKPETPGLHQQLIENQTKFVEEHGAMWEEMRTIYEPYLLDFKGSEEEAREHHADPHEKRMLRIQAWIELDESGARFNGRTWMTSAKWKPKHETAKPGKKIRLIMDLEVPASLRGFRLFDALKRAQDENILEYKAGHIEFCKSPRLTRLHKVFDRLREPDGRYHFVLFSDDSVLALRVGDKVLWFNLDISSCDASHGPAIFDVLRKITTNRCKPDMELLIKQCQAPLKIRSIADPTHCLVLRPKRPMLSSGSTITTGINNVANICIAMAIADAFDGTWKPGFIEECAARAGYIVTGGEPLSRFEEVQFLKHSPVLDVKGVWRPLLNPGVLIRATGSIDGDLPGSGCLERRANTFQYSVIRGMYPKSEFKLKQAMLSAGGPHCSLNAKQIEQTNAKVRQVTGFKVVEDSEYPVCEFASADIYRRYDLTEAEIISVDQDYGELKYGEYLNSSGLSKILTMDYGLKTIESSVHTFANGLTYESNYP